MMPKLLSKPEPSVWSRARESVMDLLFPGECALCRTSIRGARALCGDCNSTLPRLCPPFCETCGEPFDGAIDGTFDCPNCATLRFSFDFARPALPRNQRLRDMIHRLKYGREIHLAPELGRLAAGALDDPRFEQALREKWPLIPVPLHRSRLRKRQFNQAAEIARTLSQLSALPLIPALRRIRATDTQTALTRAERLKNLRGAFAVTRTGRAAAQKTTGAILVDDVFTTGSTVDACAKALRRAGFRRVAVVTVMRG